MCRKLTIPSNIEKILEKPGKLWLRDEVDVVQIWLNIKPQLRCFLIYTTVYLGPIATSQDVEDVWSRFNWRESQNKGGSFSQLRDKVILEYDPENGNFISWLKGGLKWFCKDERKRIIRKDNREDLLDPEIISIRDKGEMIEPEAVITTDELYKTLLQCIEELPEKYRVAIIMFYVDGMTVKEMAKEMDLSDSNIKVRCNRGRQMLANCLQGSYLSGDDSDEKQ